MPIKHIYINMNIKKEEKKITPIIKNHWNNKFEKAVRILIKSGCQVNDLTEKIKEIVLEDEKNNQNNGTTAY